MSDILNTDMKAFESIANNFYMNTDATDSVFAPLHHSKTFELS